MKLFRMLMLGGAVALVAACSQEVSDPVVGADVTIGSDGIRVSPSVGVIVGPVGIGVSL